MAETFRRFDAANYLTTDEDISAYLEESARDGDAAAMAVALGTVVRARNVSQTSANWRATPG